MSSRTLPQPAASDLGSEMFDKPEGGLIYAQGVLSWRSAKPVPRSSLIMARLAHCQGELPLYPLPA